VNLLCNGCFKFISKKATSDIRVAAILVCFNATETLYTHNPSHHIRFHLFTNNGSSVIAIKGKRVKMFVNWYMPHAEGKSLRSPSR